MHRRKATRGHKSAGRVWRVWRAGDRKCFPPRAPREYSGIHYGGVRFDIEIKAGKTSITHASAPIHFKIQDRAGNQVPILK
jgi:hypothetical protein